jgi:mRNA interferase MazF
MEKDFEGWNLKKQALNVSGRNKFCHPREIWWCSLGVNIGFEQDGTGKNFDRPVIVVRKFNENVFWGAALIGRKKEGTFYFPIGMIADREASVVLSQIRIIDIGRLIRKIVTIDERTFGNLKSALRRALFD